ncbi:hypothetical protein [Candidatus Binatus sp.]|uniref:hypothetical protein n=1 Tax=Candidatus Binatus sp. TaxID=2811406 RepID=UPI003C6EC045
MDLVLRVNLQLARAARDTFAGIRAGDVPGFIAAKMLGAIAAAWRRFIPVS